jgi:cytokinin dehydrogenase
MGKGVVRRSFLTTTAGAVVICGFDPIGLNWLTEARAGCPPTPELDGTLTTAPEVLAEHADDYGHIVSRTPAAVLYPGSIRDIVKMVKFARHHGLHIAMRGQGHSSFGQPQVEAGVVVNSSSLGVIHEIGADYAVVGAGVLWSALFDAAAAHGLMPPVLTDYMGLSVGGTLSVGGIGGALQHHGLQADNVLELEVVTGEGKHVACSPHHHRQLFEAVLAGLGQSALIVKAKVRLIPALSDALVFNLFYDDLETFLEDQVTVLDSGRFSYLEGQAVARTDGPGWRYLLEAVAYHEAAVPPDQTALLAGLRDNRSEAVITPQSLRDFVFRLDPLIEFLKQIGVWGFPHPGLSLWVPLEGATTLMGDVLSELTVEQTGGGAVLIYPIPTERVQAPLYSLPASRVAFAFNILRITSPDPDLVALRLAENASIYDQVAAIGGTRYPIDALPFSRRDWRRQFGTRWSSLVRAKRRFDPDGVLTPGQGIFL